MMTLENKIVKLLSLDSLCRMLAAVKVFVLQLSFASFVVGSTADSASDPYWKLQDAEKLPTDIIVW